MGPPKLVDEKQGFDLIVPLELQTKTILINMGWTPYELSKQPIYHLQGKYITFEGLLKKPKWNSFTPENDPQRNIWYRLDLEQVKTEKNLSELLPLYMIAHSANHKFDAAFFSSKDQAKELPNNNHLQYAMFWFSMAIVLATIYVLRFAVKNTKSA